MDDGDDILEVKFSSKGLGKSTWYWNSKEKREIMQEKGEQIMEYNWDERSLAFVFSDVSKYLGQFSIEIEIKDRYMATNKYKINL